MGDLYSLISNRHTIINNLIDRRSPFYVAMFD